MNGNTWFGHAVKYGCTCCWLGRLVRKYRKLVRK